MSKINTIKVLNKSVEGGGEELVISTEWCDIKVKIMILRDSNIPLVGEAQFEDFNKYAKSFDKSLEQYIHETKDILCNKCTDVEFHLKDDKFFWKKNLLWALGQITVKPETDVGIISAYTLRLINDYSDIKASQSKLEKENEELKLFNSQMSSQLDLIISLKNQMEKSIYKATIALLNTKKKRIRKLESELNTIKAGNGIYDAPTDESEDESKLSQNSKDGSINLKKRSLEEEDLKDKRKKIEPVTNEKFEDVQNKTETFLQEDEETPDFISDESAYEMELKLEDEKGEDGANSQQSSEEMF